MNRLVQTMENLASLQTAGTCPTCRRPFREGDALVAEVWGTLDAQKQKVWAENLHHQKGVKSLRGQYESIQAKKQTAVERVNEIKAMKQRVQDLEATLIGDPALDALSATIQDAETDVLRCRNLTAEHQRRLLEVSADLPKLKIMEDAYGSKGIRNFVMDDIRALMAHYVTEYANRLAGDGMSISFPQSTKTFDILLHRRGKEAHIETFSQGQTWRAHVCVLLALRKVLTHLSCTSMDFIILDDAIGDLDTAGAEAIIELAEKLSEEFTNVFATLPRKVSNIPEESIVTVVYRNGVSEVS